MSGTMADEWKIKPLWHSRLNIHLAPQTPILFLQNDIVQSWVLDIGIYCDIFNYLFML